eukprot:TRINITY_DN16432_c0_g1_i2.p2 TRINITY_DN16432_c0_g1~~TRINITY_DN16432_c0_g1_i2.p2  ORF type:complete len:132 (-),score=2.63 TRINITY_DN16432_c0_g1_i2:19-414(-)
MDNTIIGCLDIFQCQIFCHKEERFQIRIFSLNFGTGWKYLLCLKSFVENFLDANVFKLGFDFFCVDQANICGYFCVQCYQQTKGMKNIVIKRLSQYFLVFDFVTRVFCEDECSNRCTMSECMFATLTKDGV